MKETGFRFLQETKYPNLTPSDQSLELPCPPLEQPCDGKYPRYDLPKPAKPAFPLGEAVTKRRSKRKFKDAPLNLDQLSWLLWATTGVKENLDIATLRTVPSAGARHPLDTYLAINNVEGMERGLYRYLALEHRLALIQPDNNINTRMVNACLKQKWMQNAAVTFIWVAVPYRTAWRYSERAWRYLFLDAGHVCQNLYLAAEAIGCGCCAVAAYDDDGLNQLLSLDGREQFAIYLAPLGLS